MYCGSGDEGMMTGSATSKVFSTVSTAGIRMETVLKTLCADRGSRAEYVSDNCGRPAQRVGDGNQSADTSGENE